MLKGLRIFVQVFSTFFAVATLLFLVSIQGRNCLFVSSCCYIKRLGHIVETVPGERLDLVLCNFQKYQLVIPVSLSVVNIPSCPTSGNKAHMITCLIVWPLRLFKKKKKTRKKTKGDLNLKALPLK